MLKSTEGADGKAGSSLFAYGDYFIKVVINRCYMSKAIAGARE